MHLVFIRPLSNTLVKSGILLIVELAIQTNWKKNQLDAARIVTGLPILTKSEYLYAETGRETLPERRYRRILPLFFNINVE